MNNKPRILFTATFSTPFIQEDLQTLRSQYSVTEVISSGVGTFRKFLNEIRHCDITFSWFASVYSSTLVFIAKLFGKKSIIILGGVDVAKEKEYDYGIWNSWWKAIIVRYGITHADAVLAVDESLKREAIRLAKYDGHNIQVVPTGYDPERWKPGAVKENFVLSVGSIHTLARFKKKGFDILLDVAHNMTDVQFIIIGIAESVAQQFSVPDNVHIYPSLTQEELLLYYQRAHVYCQLSRHEGLPNSLCEAMLCECIPVGSDRFGIPNGIGDTGFIVDPERRNDIVSAIRNALMLNADAGKKARKRIIENFPQTLRTEQLHQVIRSLYI
ncbi:MAG: glycosyltransferase family 4 protein [Bacteroidota bacterium]